MNPKAKLHCQNLLLKYGSPTPFKGSDGHFHYLYLSYHKSSYKFYIGKHSSNDYEKDEYTGSGTHYLRALEKHGRDAFEHHILAFFNTPEEAYAKEAEEVTIDMVDREFKGLMYNLKSGGYGGTSLSEGSRKKMSESLRENTTYDLIKEGVILKDVSKKELLHLLKEGYKFINLDSLRLYHPNVNLKEIGISRGYVGISKRRSKDNFENDIIGFLEKGFEAGIPPQDHNPIWDGDVVDKVKVLLKERQDRGRKRHSESMRENTTYDLIKGEDRLEVSKKELLPLLKEGYKIISHDIIHIYHPNVNLKEIGIANGHVQIKKKSSKDNFENDIIGFLENGFELGISPQGHNPKWDEDVANKVKSLLKERQDRAKKRISETRRENTTYDLIKGDVILKGVKREELLHLLKEGYLFINLEIIQLYHPNVNLKEIGYTNGFVVIGKKVSKENFENDIIGFLENGFELGIPPQYHNPKWDEDVVNMVESFLKERQDRAKKRISETLRQNTRYVLIKGEDRQDVSKFEVLSLLKDLYRSTQVSVQICNKEGKVKAHSFDHKWANAQTREKQHLKLISLLESGEWQLGKVWEESGDEDIEETEPVIEEPVEKVMERKREYCNKRRMESLF